MKVYFDASVIIAALLSPSGGSHLLLKYVQVGKIVGISSQTAIDEILEEDKLYKFGRTRQETEKFIKESKLLIREHITKDEIEEYLGLINAEDAHLVAGANLTRCEYLVSLDKKHLIRDNIQKKFLPLRILSPKDLLEEIIR